MLIMQQCKIYKWLVSLSSTVAVGKTAVSAPRPHSLVSPQPQQSTVSQNIRYEYAGETGEWERGAASKVY